MMWPLLSAMPEAVRNSVSMRSAMTGSASGDDGLKFGLSGLMPGGGMGGRRQQENGGRCEVAERVHLGLHSI